MSETQERTRRRSWRERLPLIERAVGSARPTETLSAGHPGPSPTPSAPPAQGATAAQSAPHAPGAKQSRFAKLDLGRLERMGFLTPRTARTRLTEEYRVIKRSVLRNAFQQSRLRGLPSNLIMVSSARPTEGKTFTAVNLAISIALERDYTVLLIDGDFAKPSVTKTLGLDADKGIVDVLEDPSVDLSDVLIRTNIEKLSILPAGSLHNLSTELLASHRMSALVSEIAQRYHDRVVIFDAPPILASSEPSALAMHVGQIIMVVEADRTPRTAVREALDMINTDAHIGVVLNRCSPRMGQGQFGTYYAKA